MSDSPFTDSLSDISSSEFEVEPNIKSALINTDSEKNISVQSNDIIQQTKTPVFDSSLNDSDSKNIETEVSNLENEKCKPDSNEQKKKNFPISDSIQGNRKGTLVYIFRGDSDKSESVVFSKLCQKYGLQCWDMMIRYLPWRNRANLRTILCRILMKQALSEYEGVRADPFIIGADNKIECENNPNFKFKAGCFVNQKWDRTPDDWNRLKRQNQEKYNISQSASDAIEVPTIISIDHMLHLIANRRQTLIFKRAAIRYEKAKRKAAKEGISIEELGNLNLGIEELSLSPADILNLPQYQNSLKVTQNSSKFFVDLNDL